MQFLLQKNLSSHNSCNFNAYMSAYAVVYAEAFRRLNIDPYRSPTSICTIPVNGDETQVQTEVMDVCITSNEVFFKVLILSCH